MLPQNLQTNKPSNLIRRKSPCSFLHKGKGTDVGSCAARQDGEGPWASEGAATANGCQSTDSEKEGREGGQQERGPRVQNNSFADKGQHRNQKSGGSSAAAIPLPKEDKSAQEMSTLGAQLRVFAGENRWPYHAKVALGEVGTSTAISLRTKEI